MIRIKLHKIVSVLALALICVGAGAQSQIKAVLKATIERGWANDGDAYGNLLFQFHSQNSKPKADFHGVTIVDLKSGEEKQFLNLGFNQNYHNSSITFSKRKHTSSDKFPLLYASENYAPNSFYKILVYRIKDLKVAYDMEVVQTICMPSPESLDILYPHAFLDEDDEHVWIEAYSSDESETVFFLFDLPEFQEGTEVSLGAPIKTFRIPRKKVTDQAICMKGGKFYQVVGLSHEAWLRIIDPLSGEVIRDIDLVAEGLAFEPEAVFFHKNKLHISFVAGKKTLVYEVGLKKASAKKEKKKEGKYVGSVMPAWSVGELDIHAVNNGRGESMFYIFPDGTTMLCDAGGAIVPATHNIPGTDPKPSLAVPAGRVISNYVKHFLPEKSGGMVDYFLLSHFHGDHMGEYNESYPLHESGLFRMNGITQVGVDVPFRKIIDRGFTEEVVSDMNVGGKTVKNYRSYLKWSEETYGTKYEVFKPGALDQISMLYGGEGVSVRNVAGNGYVWTGEGDSVHTDIPSNEELLSGPKDAMTPENILSCCFHLRYGKFDWFAGGDIQYTGKTKYPWKDIETPISKVVPNVEGMKACHHGTRNANGENLLRALYPDVFVVNAWRDIHPYNDTVKRLLGINPSCQIYSTNVTKANLDRLWNYMGNFGSIQGHIVIRVAPGGESYRIFVLDDSDENYIVKSVSPVYKCR